jgi:hypothetical protein
MDGLYNPGRLLRHIRSDGWRIFAESCALPDLDKAIERMEGLAPVVTQQNGPWEWKIRFDDQGYRFEIERQSSGAYFVGGDGAYFVDDRSCPDETLLAIAESLDNRLADPRPRDVPFWKSSFAVALAIGVALAFAISFFLVLGRPQ